LTVLAISLVITALFLAVSFISTSEGSKEVASEGLIAVAAEATLSQAVVTWNIASQTVVLEQARAAGAVSIETVDSAARLLVTAANEYAHRSDELASNVGGDEGAQIVSSSSLLTAEFARLVESLEATPVAGQNRANEPEFPPYAAATGTLVQVRDERVQDVLGQAELAGEVADAVRFVVTILVPIAAMLLVRAVMKRRREREGLQNELERQTAVIESKDEFVANLSHQLRTPLTGVYGFALALNDGEVDDPETVEELSGLIAADAAELSRMVDDLITAGQVETGNVALDIEDIDIDPELEAVIDPFIGTGANITLTESGDIAVADRLRFRQIVRNLVSNAVKHGGPNIDVFTEYGNGKVSIFVMDDGDGIDDERLTQIFDRYQHEGTGPLLQGSVGLGLAIARSLATGMEGTLSYTRTNGLTYFVLRLPSHRVGKLNERVDDQSLGDVSAAKSASEVAKLFSR